MLFGIQDFEPNETAQSPCEKRIRAILKAANIPVMGYAHQLSPTGTPHNYLQLWVTDNIIDGAKKFSPELRKPFRVTINNKQFVVARTEKNDNLLGVMIDTGMRVCLTTFFKKI